VIVPLVLLVFFTLSFLRMTGDGKQILSWMVQLLYLTVGWHYTKQSFGCTLVYARYENYPVDNRQRLLLRYQLFTIWWLAGVYSNIGESSFKYYSLPYSSFNLSRSLYWGTMVIWGVLTLAVVYDVFWRNYKNSGRWPSATTLAPWVAMNLWWHPVFREETYYMFVVAFFHSLQYLAFVYRIESHRLQEEHHGPMPLSVNIFYLSGILFVSWLWFDLVPNQLDLKLDTLGLYNVEFFIVAATLFINIHHYFLDHVLWRFDNIEVRRFLLPTTTPTAQQ
jgi:hypothetical protein